MTSSTPSQYFDVLCLGQTGIGKSVTGNKLLGKGLPLPVLLQRWCTPSELLAIDRVDGELEKFPRPEQTGSYATMPTEQFFREGTEDDIDLVTTSLELLSSSRCVPFSTGNKQLRLMDCPGFGGRRHSYGGVHEADSRIVQEALIVAHEVGFQFSRVLFFLPERGALSKVHGVVQEQLEVVYSNFGPAIFANMVVVVTGTDESSTTGPLVTKTQQFVLQLLEKCGVDIGSMTLKPRVVHLSESASPAEVHQIVVGDDGSHHPLQFEMKQSCCVTCHLPLRVHVTTGLTMPALQSQLSRFPNHDWSKCHPQVTSKYTTLTKITGSVFHLLTLGIPFVLGKVFVGHGILPSLLNKEQVCGSCSQCLESPGCTKGSHELSEDFK